MHKPKPWAGSTRRSRLPPSWPALRQAVRTRAGGRCERITPTGRCPKLGNQCDHVQAGDDHRLANLEWLCGPHHAEKSSAEGNAARWG